MAKLDLGKYWLDVDNYNASLYVQKFNEEGVPNKNPCCLGHFNPRVATGYVQAIEAAIKDAAGDQNEMTLKEFMEFSKMNKENIQAWVQEQFDRNK